MGRGPLHRPQGQAKRGKVRFKGFFIQENPRPSAFFRVRFKSVRSLDLQESIRKLIAISAGGLKPPAQITKPTKAGLKPFHSLPEASSTD